MIIHSTTDQYGAVSRFKKNRRYIFRWGINPQFRVWFEYKLVCEMKSLKCSHTLAVENSVNIVAVFSSSDFYNSHLSVLDYGTYTTKQPFTKSRSSEESRISWKS